MRRFVVALASCVAAAALAQDGSEITRQRTIEGAHQFLAELPTFGTMEISEAGFVRNKVFEPVRTAACPTEGYICPRRTAKLVAIKMVDRCRSEFQVQGAYYKDSVFPSRVQKWPDNPTIYDWRSLPTNISASTGWLWVSEPGREIQMNFPSLTFPSEDLAKRTEVVLKFLREQCQKSDSGF